MSTIRTVLSVQPAAMREPSGEMRDAEDGVAGEDDGAPERAGRGVPDLDLAEARRCAAAGHQQLSVGENASERMRSESPARRRGGALPSSACTSTSRLPETASELAIGREGERGDDRRLRVDDRLVDAPVSAGVSFFAPAAIQLRTVSIASAASGGCPSGICGFDSPVRYFTISGSAGAVLAAGGEAFVRGEVEVGGLADWADGSPGIAAAERGGRRGNSWDRPRRAAARDMRL